MANRRWSVAYDRELVSQAAVRGLQTATIALGKGLAWQGMIDAQGAQHLLNMMDACKQREAELIAKDTAELAPWAVAVAQSEAILAAEAANAPPPELPPPPPPPHSPGKAKKPGKKKTRKAA